jgi:uncharacterized protein YoxC
MEGRRRWNWSIFDRCLGVFAAACAALGALYTYLGYLAAISPRHAEATPAAGQSIMTAGAPWWALALLALAIILLVVSLTRPRHATHGVVSDAFQKRLAVAEQALQALSQRQVDHVSTPQLAHQVDQQIATVENRLKEALSQLSGAVANRMSHAEKNIADVNNTFIAQFGDLRKAMSDDRTHLTVTTQGGIANEARAREASINDIAQRVERLRGEIANQSAAVLQLLDFATIDATSVLMNNILKFLPPLPSVETMTTDESLRISEFIAAVQSTLNGTPYQPNVRAILQNAEGDADQSFRFMETFPEGITPGVVRNRMIMIRQVQLLGTWLVDKRESLDGEMATKRADLAILLRQRSSTPPS